MWAQLVVCLIFRGYPESVKPPCPICGSIVSPAAHVPCSQHPCVSMSCAPTVDGSRDEHPETSGSLKHIEPAVGDAVSIAIAVGRFPWCSKRIVTARTVSASCGGFP